MGYTVAHPPHSEKALVQTPAGTFRYRVCMLSSCMCVFSLGTLVSLNSVLIAVSKLPPSVNVSAILGQTVDYPGFTQPELGRIQQKGFSHQKDKKVYFQFQRNIFSRHFL